MSRSASPTSYRSLSVARTSFLPPSHKLLQLAASRRTARPVHATDLRTTKFYRTKLCPFMQSKRGGGRCAEGFDCGYAHAMEELRNAPNLKRTKWCSKAVNGVHCSDPNCGYAHCAEELQPSTDPQTLKTSLCVFWGRDPKLCLNGNKCRFAHGVQDVRQRPALTPRCPSPMVGPALTCTKRTRLSLEPSPNGLTENIAATCSSDLSNALTMVPTTEGGFEASSESTPLLPWDEIMFARCQSRMRTALQSRYLSKVKASILHNEKSLLPLLDSEVSEQRKPVSDIQPRLSFRRQRSLEGRWKHFGGNPSDSFFAWLPGGSVEDVGGAENATTQMAEESSFSCPTTTGPEGVDIGYPAFPLFPPQVSPSDGAKASNVGSRYQEARATRCTLPSNLAKLSDSPRLPCADEHPLEGAYRISKRMEEEIAHPFIPTATSHSGPYCRIAFSPSMNDLGTSSTTKAHQPVERRIPHFQKPCTGQCRPDKKDRQPLGCPRFLQKGRDHKENCILDSPSSLHLHKQIDTEAQIAQSVPRNNSQSNIKHLTALGRGRLITHPNKPRAVQSAIAGAEEKAVNRYHVWIENNAATTCVWAANSGRDRKYTVYGTPQPIEGCAVKSACSTARSTIAPEHKCDSSGITRSKVLRRARPVGHEQETTPASALQTTTKPSTPRQSSGRQLLTAPETLHKNDKSTLPGFLTGMQVPNARQRKGTDTLNAHAPPFYPKTFLRFTYCHGGREAEAENHEPFPIVLGVSAGRYSSGMLYENVHMSKRGEKRAEDEDCRRPQEQQTAQSIKEAHGRGRSLPLDAGFQLRGTSENNLTQSILSACGRPKREKEVSRIKLPAGLPISGPCTRGGTPPSGFAGVEKKKFFCSRSRGSSTQRLSTDAHAAAETSKTSALFLSAAYSQQHSAGLPTGTCQYRLTRRYQGRNSGQHLMRSPGKLLNCTRSSSGDELCMAASISNMFRVLQARNSGNMLF